MKISTTEVLVYLFSAYMAVHYGPSFNNDKQQKFEDAKKKLEQEFAAKSDSINNAEQQKIFQILAANDAVLGMAAAGDAEARAESDKILRKVDSLQISRDVALVKEAKKLNDALAELKETR